MVRRSAGISFLSFLILIFVFASYRFVLAGNPAGNSVQDAAKGILRIRSYDWKGTLLREGMGYFSDRDGNITTIVPLLEGGYYIEAVNQYGSEQIVEWINTLSQSSGLVFTHLEQNPVDFTYIEKVAPFPAPGDNMWILNFDEDGDRRFLKATILQTRTVPGLGKYAFIKASQPLGGIGSPIVNENGEVAGMVLLQIEDTGNAGIIVSTDLIRRSYGVSGEVVSLLSWTEGNTTSWLEGETGLYLRGFAHYQMGDYRDAVKYLKRVFDTKRYGIRKAALVLGDCYRDMGDTRKAIEAYEKALSRSRKLTDMHLNLVRLYLKDNRTNEARRIWESTARYDQKGPNSVILSAWLLDATGNRDEALAAARKAAGMDPPSARAKGALGELLSRQGRFDEAFDAFRQSMVLEPGSREFAGEYCYAAIHSGRHKEAVKICEKAVRSGTRKTVDLMYLGDAYGAAGMDSKALEAYRLSIKEDPRSLRTWCRMGDLLAESGQYQEAISALQSAVISFPGSAWIHFKLGKVFGLMGDLEAASEKVQTLRGFNRPLADQLSLLLMQNKGPHGPLSRDSRP